MPAEAVSTTETDASHRSLPTGLGRPALSTVVKGLTSFTLGRLILVATAAVLAVPLFLWWLTLTTPHPASSLQNHTDAGGGTVNWTIAAAIAALLIWPLIEGEAQKHWYLFRRISVAAVGSGILLVAATIGLAFGLVTCFPGLDRSWLYRVLPEQGAGNLILLPTRLPLIGLPYLLLVIANLPRLAAQEERHYRRGTRDWWHGIFRSIRFGLTHCLGGVPLFAGIALILPGLWWTHLYFRKGEEEAAVRHLTYNLLVVIILAVFFVAHV